MTYARQKTVGNALAWFLLLAASCLIFAASVEAQTPAFTVNALSGATATGASSGYYTGLNGLRYYVLSVFTTGGPTGCTIALQSSADNSSYSNVTATSGSNPYTCTSDGQIQFVGYARYFRVNLTALSGGTAPTVTAVLQGFHWIPSATGAAVAGTSNVTNLNAILMGIEDSSSTLRNVNSVRLIDSSSTSAGAGVPGAGLVQGDRNETTAATTPLFIPSVVRSRATSAANTAQSVTLDLRGASRTLAIHMTCSAGTATLTVEASVDNSNFLTIDSIGAAATTVQQYTPTTVGGTVALSPLSFRYVKITAGAAGASNTTTLTTSAK